MQLSAGQMHSLMTIVDVLETMGRQRYKFWNQKEVSLAACYADCLESCTTNNSVEDVAFFVIQLSEGESDRLAVRLVSELSRILYIEEMI